MKELKLIEKIKNRHNIVSIIFLVLVALLISKLSILTIAEGDYYRDISDNKRLKEVYTTAPRGEIRDRYGRLLAGNKPSFTVQILKDEINTLTQDKKNDGILRLVRFLEEDGVSYEDEYPLTLNVFKYKNESDYFTYDLEPMNSVLEIIINNNLLPEILGMYYIHDDYEEHYQFVAINKAINALKNKNIDVPIDAFIDQSGLVLEFNTTVNIENWKNQNDIPLEYSPMQAILKLIDNDKTIVRKIIDHPVSRLMVFNLINSKGLAGNLTIDEYSLTYYEDYLSQKRSLMKHYNGITMETSAKEDFVNIFIKTSLNSFLDKIIAIEESSEPIIPGNVLIQLLERKGVEVDIEIETTENYDRIIYKYTGVEDIGDKSPKDVLINLANEHDILSEFITMANIKGHAQVQLLSDGVNPRISIADDFEYVSIRNLKNWYSANLIKEDKSEEEAFQKIRDNYKIDSNLSKYEVRSMLVVYDQISKQGHLAYQPINLAYGIKESTVAKIEEGLIDIPGVDVSIEPVRYYPEGTTAAHILGYLGKISQASEIKKYIEEAGYSPSAIIGKTGIEESYEDVLSGESGVRRVEVDSIGNTTKVLGEIEPIPGDNVYLSIDLEVQKVAESSLQQTLEKLQVGGTYESKWGDYQFGINRSKGKPYDNATSGAVVAVDVKTGQVIAMASYPSYNPNLFSTGISTTDWQSLFPEDELNPLAPRPLYNIATQTAIQPGSTFKMVTALAALDKGLHPQTRIRDMGYVSVGTDTFRCLIWTNSGRTHGYENVAEALRDSCNYFFYTLAIGYNQRTGEQIGVKLEIEDIVNLSKQLGLNDKSGIEINVPSEFSGGVPDPQQKTITTKYLLRQFLIGNVEKYLKEEVSFDEETKSSTIDEIVSWSEYEEPITRNEVRRRLDKLGIDPDKKMPGERNSLTDKIKYTYLNQVGWNLSDTLNVTIGQGLNSYTPIQMANFISTLSNGGYRHELSLIESIKNYNNTVSKYEHEPTPERIFLNNYENLEHVKKGMEMVSKEGTARRIFNNFPVTVGSKTGTAQRSGVNPSTGEKFDDFAWFVAFAPYEDPEIAVATVIFQGGSGGYAGPLSRDIIAQYLGLNNVESNNILPHESILID
ncbi:MAG: penicillin-binding protein [Tissierellia bacterium]|nr:penicillin-binding protein [Tissierellia bacterium]